MKEFEVVVPQNEYDTLINHKITKINDVLVAAKSDDTLNIDSQIISKGIEINKLRTALSVYLKGKGVTEDSLNDISIAHKTINLVEGEIRNLRDQISMLEAQITDFDQSIGSTNATEYGQIINQKCIEINSKLSSIQSDHVKAISISYGIDEEKMKKMILEEFKTIFHVEIKQGNFQEQSLNELLCLGQL